jgi:serine/threonine protein kinase
MRDKNFLYFLLEPSLGGELFSVLRVADKFDNDTARFYAGIVVCVFQYLHARDILYRDLKPENLLMDAQGYLKITDFGFAKMTRDRTYTFCGTPDYLAPEIVASAGHHTGADWWTLGVLVYEMLVGYTPFYDEAGPASMYSKILAGKVAFPQGVPAAAQDLVRSLLQTKPTRRLGVLLGGAEVIKNHAWFRGFDWAALTSRQMPAPIPVNIKDKFDLSNFDAYADDDLEDDEFVPDQDNPDWDAVF